MYTYARHRHATRWPRCLLFALAILLVLVLLGHLYRAWQAVRVLEPAGQVV